jgi:hypothetical protein
MSSFLLPLFLTTETHGCGFVGGVAGFEFSAAAKAQAAELLAQHPLLQPFPPTSTPSPPAASEGGSCSGGHLPSADSTAETVFPSPGLVDMTRAAAAADASHQQPPRRSVDGDAAVRGLGVGLGPRKSPKGKEKAVEPASHDTIIDDGGGGVSLSSSPPCTPAAAVPPHTPAHSAAATFVFGAAAPVSPLSTTAAERGDCPSPALVFSAAASPATPAASAFVFSAGATPPSSGSSTSRVRQHARRHTNTGGTASPFSRGTPPPRSPLSPAAEHATAAKEIQQLLSEFRRKVGLAEAEAAMEATRGETSSIFGAPSPAAAGNPVNAAPLAAHGPTALNDLTANRSRDVEVAAADAGPQAEVEVEGADTAVEDADIIRWRRFLEGRERGKASYAGGQYRVRFSSPIPS